MILTILLPGQSPASDLALAPQMARLGALHLLGKLPSRSVPSGTANACEDEGCEFLGEDIDNNGVVWLVYDCDGTIKAYRA